MSYIIDRRLNGKHKSTVNRQRFLDRYRRHIREAVNDAVGRRSIQDMEQGERITIPRKDLSEPIFHHGSGGRRNVVHPGNKEFQQGDRIKKPSGGEGGGGGQKAGDSGEGDDEFAFQIDPREFLNFCSRIWSCPTWSSASWKAPAVSICATAASSATAFPPR